MAGSYEPNEHGEEILTVLKGPLLVRHPAWRRLLSWSAFTLKFIAIILRHRYKLVLVTTNPPFCPWVLGVVNFLLNRPYIYIVYDIYPDVLARMGSLSQASIVYRMFKWLNISAMRQASAVVTLGDDMVKHLERQCGSARPPIEVIASWADTTIYRPLNKNKNPFVAEHGLEDKFVVMYSGAFGATHDMDSILTAAESLKEYEDIVFVLIGKGTRFVETESKIVESRLPNVILLGWQPITVVPSSLAAADCHIVSLDALYSGISFPSKFYTSISVGAPILAVAETETDLSRIVLDEELGLTVQPGRPDELVEGILRLHRDPESAARMGARGRKLAEERYDEKVCTQRYLDLLERICYG